MAKVTLKNVRLSFPYLFTARTFKPGDEPKFKATLLIPKDDPQVTMVEAAIKQAGIDKGWGAKTDAIIKSIRGNPNKFCFQDGNTRDYDGYDGMMALSASSKARPLIIDRAGVRNEKDKDPSRNYTSANSNGWMFPLLVEADGRPYAGCYVNASIEVFGYTNSGNGISAALKGVQFVRDGDSFGGGAPASPDDFDDLGVGGDDDLIGDVPY